MMLTTMYQWFKLSLETDYLEVKSLDSS